MSNAVEAKQAGRTRTFVLNSRYRYPESVRERAALAEGRAQRDGQVAEAIYTYVEDSTEQQWPGNVFRSAADTDALTMADGPSITQGDIESFRGLADALQTEHTVASR